MRLRHYVEESARTQNALMTEGMGEVYDNAYYRSEFNFQQGIGLALPFSPLTPTALDKAISTKWLGANYSDRIWENKERLLATLDILIPRGIAQGKNPNVIGKELAKQMGVAKNVAVRLARTEYAHLANEATMDRYKEHGIVKQYQILVALDERTCEICGALDLTVYDVDEAAEGLNEPPFHPNCRCTTISYFPPSEIDAMFDKGTRIARDPVTADSYYVPKDMTYAEWRASLTAEQDGALRFHQKAAENKSGDKEQFAEYKAYISAAKKEYDADTVNKLFEGFPTKFADFQQMKYQNSDMWEAIKDNRQQLGSVETSKLPKDTKAPDTILQATIGSPNMTGIIPQGADIGNVRIIAGTDTSTNLRISGALSDKYGGNPLQWSKKGGIIETEYKRYDVHWNEMSGTQYDTKIVGEKTK
jgi:SPP1 gp7 family putative phage head morphogenesis protein